MTNFFNGKEIAVTGATGLVGSYIVKALAELGANVRAIAHIRPPNEFTNMATQIVKKDLMILSEACEAIRGAEIVIHAGGITGGIPLAINDPGALVAPNAIFISSVIHACAKENVERLAFISSTVVYPALDRPVREEDVWTGDPYPAYFGISWVKRFAEKLCEFYSKSYELKIAILRPTGVYGRYDNFDENVAHVLPAFISRALAGGDPFVVWGDGNDIRDFLHSSDLAKATLLAVEKYATCDPINVASGQPISTHDLARLVLDLTGSKARLVTDPSKPRALKVRMIDISKAKKVLGFEPSVPLKEGIEDTIEWYQNSVGR